MKALKELNLRKRESSKKYTSVGEQIMQDKSMFVKKEIHIDL